MRALKFAFISVFVFNATMSLANTNDQGEYYENGKLIQYKTKNDIEVHALAEWKKSVVGKYYYVSLRIVNKSDQVFNVMPENSHFIISKKGDLRDEGRGLAYDKFTKRAKKKVNNNAVWTAIALGMSEFNAGYSESYSSSSSGYGTYTTSYSQSDVQTIRFQNQQTMKQYNAELSDALNHEVESYLKPETMDNFEEIYGLIAFPSSKGDELHFEAQINGQVFDFHWTFIK